MSRIKQEVFSLIDDIAFYRKIKDLNKSEVIELETLALKLLTDYLTEESITLELAVIGNFSSGKSTFINSLLGKKICPMAVNPTTSIITKFFYGEIEEIYLVESGNKQKISFEEYQNVCQHIIGKESKKESFEVHYCYPEHFLKTITLYDTPGFNNPKNDLDQLLTERISKTVDVVILLTDINIGGIIDDSLQQILEEIRKSNKNLKWYYVINKCDSKPLSKVYKILDNVKNKYGKNFDKYFIYSSKKILDDIRSISSNVTDEIKVFFNERSRIIEELHNLSKQKNLIKQENIKNTQINYKHKKSEVLEKILELIEKKISCVENNMYNKDIDIIINKSISEYQKDLQLIMLELLNFLKNSFTINDVSKEEKSYLITPYKRIIFYYNAITVKPLETKIVELYKKIFTTYKENLSSVDLKIEDTFVQNYMNTHLKNISLKLDEIRRYYGPYNKHYFDDHDDASRHMGDIIHEYYDILAEVIKDGCDSFMKNLVAKVRDIVSFHKGNLYSNNSRLKEIKKEIEEVIFNKTSI